MLFEVQVIDWLREASILAVARLQDLTWDQVAGIQQRAVARGLGRRRRGAVGRIGVDETSFQKRHEYVTVVIDLDTGRVLYVGEKRKKASLDGFYGGLEAFQLEAIEAVAMDMWEPYIQSTLEHVPGAEGKICFDKFHVAKHLGEAVDQVRREEHRARRSEGDELLKGTRYHWLQNPENMERCRRKELEELRQASLKTGRAWSLKEAAKELWGYVRYGWAEKAWHWWIGWALRSRLEPMRKVGRMVKRYLWGILNAVVKGVTNARCESINSKIQWLKRMACGYRNRERFREAILFHCGGLDLYPRA
jgi:transposase